MDYSFCNLDLEKGAKCESCEREADHVLVLLDRQMVGVFQICYECSVMLELDKEHRVIPKKNAKQRNEKCTPMCNPRK